MVALKSPKHIAREINVPARRVRAMLRDRYGLARNNRWKFNEEEARQIALSLAEALRNHNNEKYTTCTPATDGQISVG